VVHKTAPKFVIGKAITLQEGRDVCLLAAGTVLPVAVEAAGLLAAKGITARVVSFHTIKPLDTEMLSDSFENFKVVATLEEHSILGGLGGSVAEWLSDQPDAKARLVRFGTADEFLHLTCEQEEAREHFGLTAANIAAKLESSLK
jgi:transketolase